MAGTDPSLTFYLSLLSVQMAILGLVVAGIVTLLQLLHRARPRRVMSLLIRPAVLYSYILFLALTLIALCVASWSIAFEVTSIMRPFLYASVGGGLLLFCLAGLFWFVSLVYKTRRLLEPDHYLAAYIASVSSNTVRDYLFHWFSERPDGPDTAPATRKAWEARFARTEHIADPFQPVREYLKDNAFNSYDYGTASGLRFFSTLFDQTFADIKKNAGQDEYYYLAKYLADSCEEFFNIFCKTASEKRQMDTIRLVASKGQLFLTAPRAEGLSTVIRSLENLAKAADDEDEVIACIERIQELTDAYLAGHPKAAWQDVAETFEDSCLAVTRLAETYYLQKDNPLRTVPIIGHYTGEHQSATFTLVDFFDSYHDLGDRYPDVYPLHYFEAIEAVTEVLFARYAEIVGAGQQTRGLNLTYQHLVSRLYTIYRTFGLDAIEHHKPELLALSIGNLRRIVKPAKNLGLVHEHAQLTKIILELATEGILALGDTIIKDTRTMTMYVHETLAKHADSALIAATLKELGQGSVDLTNAKLQPFLEKMRTIK